MNLRRVLQHISYDDRHSAHTSPCCRKNVQFRSLKKCGFPDANLGIGAGLFASVKAVRRLLGSWQRMPGIERIAIKSTTRKTATPLILTTTSQLPNRSEAALQASL
jgi:hypothetical protein